MGGTLTTTLTRTKRRVLDPFTAPLYTVPEAARHLNVPTSTLRNWAKGYDWTSHGRTVHGDPILTTVKATRSSPASIPFVGLAEGLVLAAIRQSGVPLQRIRPALTKLDEEFGIQHALASKKLYTDGAEVLLDISTNLDDPAERQALGDLVVVRNGQRVFNDVVKSYLKRIKYDAEGYVHLIRLPAYSVAEVIVDPTRGFGQPIFARGGVRLEDALSLFRAGESLGEVAEEFGVPIPELEDAVRVATRVAA
ncbi:MAG: DUF433 domain-containing protein [Actinobacteria bacterium]|nr:DUF433 domain-containing protein [Actinomycetota bacterium]